MLKLVKATRDINDDDENDVMVDGLLMDYSNMTTTITTKTKQKQKSCFVFLTNTIVSFAAFCSLNSMDIPF